MSRARYTCIMVTVRIHPGQGRSHNTNKGGFRGDFLIQMMRSNLCYTPIFWWWFLILEYNMWISLWLLNKVIILWEVHNNIIQPKDVSSELLLSLLVIQVIIWLNVKPKWFTNILVVTKTEKSIVLLFTVHKLTRLCLEVQIDIIMYYWEVLVLRGKTNLILRNPNKYYTWLTVNKTLIRRVRMTLESALLRRGRGSLGWSIHPISPGMLSNASSSRGL